MADYQTDDRAVAQTAAEGDVSTPELPGKDSGLFVEDFRTATPARHS